MGKANPSMIRDLESMLAVVESVFTEFNLGFLIYHLQDAEDPKTLKLVYANDEASEYTESDMQRRVGSSILDAFPGLAETDIPEVYAEVVRSNQAQMIGLVEYADQDMKSGSYSVKAFPLPNDCVGVVFEDVNVRRQVDAMLKKETVELAKQSAHLESTVSKMCEDVTTAALAIQTDAEALQSTLTGEDRKRLDAILERVKDIEKALPNA